MSAAGAGDALARLAEELAGADVIGAHVRASDERPALGELAAAGPRAAQAREEYVLLFEAIREGYLLHYRRPRLLDGADPDLRLLAGDYLYALGLRRLAARADLDAVRELGDLISLSAQLHASGSDGAPERVVHALWLASATAVGRGASKAHEAAKRSARERRPEAEMELIEAALDGSGKAIRTALARAADSIGFASEHLPDRG